MAKYLVFDCETNGDPKGKKLASIEATSAKEAASQWVDNYQKSFGSMYSGYVRVVPHVDAEVFKVDLVTEVNRMEGSDFQLANSSGARPSSNRPTSRRSPDCANPCGDPPTPPEMRTSSAPAQPAPSPAPQPAPKPAPAAAVPSTPPQYKEGDIVNGYRLTRLRRCRDRCLNYGCAGQTRKYDL